MAEAGERNSVSERDSPRTVSGPTCDNQRANSLTDEDATVGIGPDDSVRGSGVIVADVRSSTSIVAEVSRIAGLADIGPVALSAAAMTGNGESRRAVVNANRLSRV